ncbi:MAG TPA: AraC family transcriptional regulator [Alphaproteobacteria bacterium]|nr:AraC family transcriptional regulator [Alphaproteobacteria bacterium]
MLTTVAEIGTPTTTVEVLKGEWPRPIEHIWVDPRTVVTMLFRPSDYEAEGHYVDSGPGYARDKIGQVFLIPSNAELHGWGSGGEIKAARCLFEPGFLERTLGAGFGLTSSQRRNCLDVRSPLVSNLLRRLMEEALSPGFAATAMVEALGNALLIECTRYATACQEGDYRRKIGLTPRQKRLIEHYIESHDCGTPSVSALAALCGLSERYFCRLFREETGQSVGRYLKSVQIDRAKRYLLDTDLPLKEIAFRLGFANAANFSAAFRAAMDLPPIAFRRRHAKSIDFMHRHDAL